MKSWKKVDDKNLKTLRGGQDILEYALLIGTPLEKAALTVLFNVIEGRMPEAGGIKAIEGMIHTVT